jgi:hypothetical protein
LWLHILQWGVDDDQGRWRKQRGQRLLRLFEKTNFGPKVDLHASQIFQAIGETGGMELGNESAMNEDESTGISKGRKGQLCTLEPVLHGLMTQYPYTCCW